jgi:hypothetical protein
VKIPTSQLKVIDQIILDMQECLGSKESEEWELGVDLGNQLEGSASKRVLRLSPCPHRKTIFGSRLNQLPVREEVRRYTSH